MEKTLLQTTHMLLGLDMQLGNYSLIEVSTSTAIKEVKLTIHGTKAVISKALIVVVITITKMVSDHIWNLLFDVHREN